MGGTDAAGAPEGGIEAGAIEAGGIEPGIMETGPADGGAPLAPGPVTSQAVLQALQRIRAVFPRSFSSSAVYLAAQAGQLTSMTLGAVVQEPCRDALEASAVGRPLIQRLFGSNHIMR